ncbi:MAG TPA: SusC/RagA family TonB-linked outer membrane protein [Gemmatimonadota bacterium]|nr:SusC/RagA family TonB-linked outer membrane protein [Gemmatimonadota bacterium]
MTFDRLFLLIPRPFNRSGEPRSLLLLLAFVLLSPAVIFAQATIQGTVTEQDGDPLVGAQVQVVGTDLGAVTDSDGNYRITGLPTGPASLRVLYLGYREGRRQLSLDEGANLANFELASSPIELDAIVVTGTAGNVQRRAVGNAISDIDASEVLEKAPVANLGELIQGRAAGAVVLPSAGTVGSGTSIRLRGLSSITQSNEPLLYVDGVRVDNDPEANSPIGFTVGGQGPSRLNDIVPENIESIEIIKGPAAATLYGTEAAAGVIHIITKKGQAGDTRWNVRASLGRTDFNHVDFPDNFAVVDEVPACVAVDIGDAQLTEDNCGLRVVETLEDGQLLIAQNALDIFTDEAVYQDYTASASGGREDFTFYASGNFTEEDGVLPNNFAEKFGGRANFQWSPSEVFDLSVSSGYTNNDLKLPNNDNNIFGFFGNGFLASPGRIRRTATGLNFAFGEPFTPLDDVAAINSHYTNDRFTGSVNANFNPVSWFRNRAIFGIDLNAEENTQFIPFGEIANLSPLGERTNVRETVFNVTFDYNGTVSWDLTPSLQSNTSVGTQVTNENIDTVTAFGMDFPAPGVSTVSAAGTTQGFESRLEDTTVGVYFQEQLGWQNRLFLTGAVRFDDNSAFGGEFDFETYPKVSASYVISEEPWFTVPGLDQLKLRAAYGFAGRQPQAFAFQRTFAPVSIRGGIPTITPGEVGNPELGPERSSEIELGFDASVWDDRIGVEVTYYDKTVEDALVNRPNVPSRGFPGSQLFNLGELQSSGWELGVNGLIIDTDVVDYQITLTAATNDNEVVELGEGIEGFGTPASFAQRIEEGFPLDAYFGRVIVSREEDGTRIFSDEEEFLGRATPDFFGSFGSTVTLWDNLQLYALFDWKRGFKAQNATEEFRWLFGNNRVSNDPALQEGQEFEDILAFLAIGQGTPFIEDGDFVKLREVSGTYTLPNAWAGAIRAARASLTLAGRNLATWTDYSGVDPEVNFTGQDDLARADFLSVPQARRFVATLNLTY